MTKKQATKMNRAVKNGLIYLFVVTVIFIASVVAIYKMNDKLMTNFNAFLASQETQKKS